MDVWLGFGPCAEATKIVIVIVILNVKSIKQARKKIVRQTKDLG